MHCSRQCPWLVSVRFVVPALDHEKGLYNFFFRSGEAGVIAIW
ncbi:hypothetical protein [Brasilonema bromeliae]